MGSGAISGEVLEECPLCREYNVTGNVAVGPLSLRICEYCAAAGQRAMKLFNAIFG
jgi:hypothetical protein